MRLYELFIRVSTRFRASSLLCGLSVVPAFWISSASRTCVSGEQVQLREYLSKVELVTVVVLGARNVKEEAGRPVVLEIITQDLAHLVGECPAQVLAADVALFDQNIAKVFFHGTSE